MNSNREIESVFQPVLDNLPIKACSYVRYLPNGQRFFVTNSTNLVPHLNWVFSNTPNPSLPQTTQTISRVSTVDALIMTTTPLMQDFYSKMTHELFSRFSLGYAFSLLQKKPSYYEEFIFFPELHNAGSYQTLFSSEDLLRHFSFYFLDKMHGSLENVPLIRSNQAEQEITKVDLNKNRFLKEVTPKRFYLDELNNVYLTRKEATCAYYLTKNLSSTQIGSKMFISKRTVEDHIENIKLKSSTKNKSELIEYLTQNGFHSMSMLIES